MANAVSMAGPQSGQLLRVCLCHVRLPPRLPFKLFGFNIANVDADGELSLDPAGDEEILYALVVNQPVDIQRETAIAFLNDFVGRQAVVGDIRAERRDIAGLPDMAASADATSAEVAADALRFSIQHAAETLKARAASAGYRLEVRYQTDPLPRQADVARRVPILRQLYNEEPDVRQAVDGTVSLIGGKPPMLRGGFEQARTAAQQYTAVTGVRQFMNQVTRDADVCGNGYLESDAVGLEPTLRCLRPEAVEVVEPDVYRLVEGAVVRGRVSHLRGLEQFNSPYGLSPWEPLLFLRQRAGVIDAVLKLARMTQQDRRESTRSRVQELERLAEQIRRETESRVQELLWFSKLRLARAEGNLYFAGQERMH